jgi:23S rRNA (uracil1939-C5)-methyltransferase
MENQIFLDNITTGAVMSLQKNHVITLTITGITHDGDGIGRSSCGMAVFVPMSAVGDELQVRIVKVLSNRAYGIIESIIIPSPDRCEPGCEAYRKCGGCSLRHITPVAEMRVKNGFVRENLERIGGISPELEPPIDSPKYSRYRNKAAYPVRNVGGRVVCGFYARRSHRLVEVGDCPLQPAFFADITACVCGFCEEFAVPPYDEQSHSGLLRHIVIRHAQTSGQVMVSLVINGKTIPHADILTARLREACPNLTTLVPERNTRKTNVIGGDKQTPLFGGGFITDKLCGVELEISPGSFYQINYDVAKALYGKALEYAEPKDSDVLLDLYCGTGAIGLSMAHAVREVIGVESVPEAVKDAGRNAERNGIKNARFICADSAKAAQNPAVEGTRPDIIVIDPPRAGADTDTLNAICGMKPGRIIYISCNSATQARDCAFLRERGYVAVRGCAANMFPRTSHVESILLLIPTENRI